MVKHAPREVLTGGLAASAAPPRVSRTMYAANTTGRAATPVVGSSITYDPQEHRFVNANNSPNRANGAIASNEVKTPTATMGKDLPPTARVIQPAQYAVNSGYAAGFSPTPSDYDAAASALFRGWLLAAEFRLFWWRGLGRRPRLGRFFRLLVSFFIASFGRRRGARIRANRFGDSCSFVACFAAPRYKPHSPYYRSRRVFCKRVRQTSYPRSRPRRRDRPRHLRKWHSARVPLFLHRGVASP